MKKISIERLIVTVFFTLLVLGGGAVIVTQVVVPWLKENPFFSGLSGNNTVMGFHEYHDLDRNVTQLIYNGSINAVPAFVEYRGGTPHVYINAEFLRVEIDPFIFWDEYARVLFISTLDEMLEFQKDSDFFLNNGSPYPLEEPVIERNGEIFLPVSLISGLYPLDIEYRSVYNLLVVTPLFQPQTTAIIAGSNVNVRYRPSEREAIAVKLEQGERVVLYVGADDENSDYVRVRTYDGLIGYVLISEIERISTDIPGESVYRDTILRDYIENTVYRPRIWDGGAVNLIWEAAYNTDANRVNMNTNFHPSTNVVSPTWFELNENGTELVSVASREYADWAHEQGVQVWPRVFDGWYDRSRAFLTNRNARQHVINQLIEFVELYNLDGLNIDFEHLSAADGPYNIQFLRELAIPMRQRGIVLSSDVTVPIAGSMFYRRDLMGLTVDFVMVMAYDEFWSTSPEAGPNASLPFVRNGVANMLEEVPNDRLVLCLPFYNRIWHQVASTGEVSHHGSMGTTSTRAFFEERGVEWVWDFENGAYFGEAVAFEDGETVIYRVWLEDARSIQEKMHVYNDNGLAGIAIWNRLMSIEEFWDVIGMYF